MFVVCLNLYIYISIVYKWRYILVDWNSYYYLCEVSHVLRALFVSLYNTNLFFLYTVIQILSATEVWLDISSHVWPVLVSCSLRGTILVLGGERWYQIFIHRRLVSMLLLKYLSSWPGWEITELRF